MKFRINIDFTDDHGKTDTHTIQVEAQLSEIDAVSIDNVEKSLLALNKEAIRQAIVAYFEDLSKKKPERSKEILAALSEQILPHIESMGK